MDPSNVIQLVIVFVLLALSAFFSSAETAFTTANKIRLRSLADEGNKKAALALKISGDSGKMLSAILIGNNIVNIAASSLTTTFALNVFGPIATGIATAILTVLVLIFGEITPKTAATCKSDSIVLAYARVVNFIIFIFTPVIFVINTLANLVMKLLRIDPNAKGSSITETELRTIVDVSHEEGVIESEERRIINNLFDFGDSQAKDVMIPRIDMTVADVNSTYDDIVAIFRQEKYTRIPIFEESIDNVIGIINVKDLLLYDSSDDFNIHEILREAYYTYEHKNVSELMAELRKTTNSITIVIDEYGSTVGMITLEDLLEEIVGEIRDEYDFDEKDPIQRVSDTEFLLEGTTKLDDINELLEINLRSNDYDSIAGLIIEELDRFPVSGDVCMIKNVKLVVEEVNKNRIDSVRLYLDNSTTETPATE